MTKAEFSNSRSRWASFHPAIATIKCQVMFCIMVSQLCLFLTPLPNCELYEGSNHILLKFSISIPLYLTLEVSCTQQAFNKRLSNLFMFPDFLRPGMGLQTGEKETKEDKFLHSQLQSAILFQSMLGLSGKRSQGK